MSKNIDKFAIESGNFAKNDASSVSNVNKNAQKTQNYDKHLSNERAIDKKLVKGILKDEKKQLKQSKKQKKQQEKQENKQKKAKIKEIVKQKKLEDKQVKSAQEATLRELEKRGRFASWFRLDNAASIYPSAAESDWNFVFRITAVMKNKVDEKVLQSALDDIMTRFPSFNVRLCRGFFWNYYERNFSRLKIEKESTFPCAPFNLNDPEGFLLRVIYDDYKISLEVFHAITDGRGALTFLNSLIVRYFEKLGFKIEDYKGCLNYLDLPTEEEMEDSFFSAYTTEKLKRPKEKSAYKIKGNVLPSGVVNTIEGEMSIKSVKEISQKFGVSVTTFLASVVGFVIYKKRKTTKKPVRISIPIDLRPRFNSSTLRNFSSYINVEIGQDNLSFEDVVQIFKKTMESVDMKFLQSNINSNVRIQKNFFVKILPLFIKNIILKNCFNYMGENYQTLALSNLGLITLPKEIEDEVESYCMNLGRSKHNEKSIGIASYKDTLNICISSKLYETETERDVFMFLSSLGIDVKIYSNRRDLYATR